MTKKVLMLVGDFVENIETYTPFYCLKMLGFQVDAICPNKTVGDKIQTACHDMTNFQTYEEKQGHTFMITADFNEVAFKEYDGLWIPGGRAPEYLRMNNKVVEIVRYFIDQNKPIGCICHGS